MTHYIYLIYAVTDNIIAQWKIGVSKHPEKRFKELQTANPNIVRIEALFEVKKRDVAYKLEALLKKYLKPFKINGEWIEFIALNSILFFEYCERFNNIAETLIEIKNNKKEIY